MPMVAHTDDIIVWAPFSQMEKMVLSTAIALEICKRDEVELFGGITALGEGEFDYVPAAVLDLSVTHPYSYNLFIAWRRLTLSFLNNEVWPFPGEMLELPYTLPG